MQTDKVKLSRLLLAQKPRQLAFATDRERYAAPNRTASPFVGANSRKGGYCTLARIRWSEPDQGE